MIRPAMASFAFAALLAGCSNAGFQAASSTSALAPTAQREPGASKQRSIPVPAAGPVTVRPYRGKSWISPDVKRAPRLLFVSDYGASDVDIFTMPKMELKGTLAGFSFPEGECSDAQGNIWIANTGEMQMLLYSRTGTLLKTLDDYGEYPSSCAVNYKTGDLAVANIESGTAGPGNVTVYANASGSGTAYSNPSFNQYFFVGYDLNGNLFFDGTDESRTISYLAELPAGSNTTTLITLGGGTLYLAGFVQWYRNGNYLALGDQECTGTAESCVYWVSLSGSTGTITATTYLANYEGNPVCDLVQGVIAANGERYVAGPDYEACEATPSTVYRWPYEAGGSPTNYNSDAELTEPVGAAVSTK
jgi:hypothetical protein